MLCTNCGAEAPREARFCPQCGAGLQAPCSTCGAAIVAGARFCAQCGTAVEATASSADSGAPAPPVASERKLVSVLFADLVGFTTLAEGRDHEAVRELLSRYFERCQEVIARYGGTVEKFIGDAVMAVWGAPIARENDAERAVRAALDLVDAVRGLGPGIQARAGVLTGEAAVTIGATNQGIVAGDIVNTASRLQSVAMPGTVLVGESTQQAAESAIAFEPAGDQVLKGKTVPVPAYRAVRVIAERGGRGRSEGLEAPFLGRDDEFRLLRDLVHGTSRDRRARLVSIVGAAGVGKSRMGRELSNYLDGVVETIYWHAGRSPAYGEGVTFWALGEMVRGRIGTAEGDDEATTRAAVAESVGRWIPDETERRWVERALLVLLGIEGSGGLGRDELFAAWRTFFERIAAHGAVVLLFEDLHWADAGLLDFIDHVLDWSKGAPLALVTLARPELLDRRPDWGAGRRSFVSMAIEPLPEADLRRILDALVPGLPTDAANAIIGRADGIPLYAVETVRMLVADGKLVAEDGRYRPTGDLGELAVPATLQALISARLDALDPQERAFICDAAVLGQSFTPAGLAAVSGQDDATVQKLLRSLARQELVVEHVDPRSPERGQFAFEQALVREVAYGTLSRRDRRSRHLAAARFFESLGEDELAGALASHYLAAYRASAEDTAEAQPLAAQARLALRAAADRAAALGSHDQAVGYFVEAIDVTSNADEQADLYELAGLSALTGGRSEVAERHVREAIRRWHDLGNRPREAMASAHLGRVLVNRWATAEAIAFLEPAAATFADLEHEPGLAVIEHQLARAYWFDERTAPAIAAVDRALGRAERLDDAVIIADMLVTKGSLVASGGGRPFEGIALLEAGRSIAEGLGLNDIVGRALLNLGVAYIGRDPRRAFDTAVAALVLARRIGFRSTLATAAGNAMEAAIMVGDLDWALAMADELAVMDLDASDRVTTLRGPMEARALRGEPVDDIVAEFRRLMEAIADPSTRSNFHGAIAMVDFAAGRYAEAVANWRLGAGEGSINGITDLPRAARAALWAGDELTFRAITDDFAAHFVQGPASRARFAVLRAAAAGLAGQREEAMAALPGMLAGLRELGLELESVLAIVDMATVLGPDEPALAGALDEARELIGRMGLRPIGDVLDRLTGIEAGARGATATASRASGQAVTRSPAVSTGSSAGGLAGD